MRAHRGFSLLEVLIVVALVGIAAALGFGMFRPDRFRVQQAARGFASQIAFARLQAIRENRPAGVFIDQSGSGRYMVFVDRNDDRLYTPNQSEEIHVTMLGTGELGGIRLTTNLFYVLFDSRGIPIAPGGVNGLGNGTVVFSTNDRSYTRSVVVSAQGRTRIE